MPIDPSVVAPRVPRLGTITVGRGKTASSQAGREYSQPRREDTLVFHTNDGEVANAVQMLFGGDVFTESPTWGFDVVTDATQMTVRTLTSLFRQDLCAYSRSQTLRRCDGVRMSMIEGRPASADCLCVGEMAAGKDRTCSPYTNMPVLIDLDVDRAGTWEVKSTSWGTAANIAGTMRLLLATGLTGEVPAILEMRKRVVKDAKGETHEVPELHLTPAVSLAALTGDSRPALDSGAADDDEPPMSAEDDRALAVLNEIWESLLERAGRLDILPAVREWWRTRHGGRPPEQLGLADMRTAVEEVRAIVDDVEASMVAAAAATPLTGDVDE